ncbi:hypothetical protein [Nocardioides sp. 1609]|uniref:hypothetical protein n=1 Tax=Nocardioides sp. 1609 TaxID=2508327 RepID=UPI00106FCB4C|nr:hypothetical protein [Nocardioides sp. 1609]
MKTPSTRTAKIAGIISTPVALLVVGLMVWQSSYAAFTGTTRNSGNSWATGSVALTDDDAGSARFQVADMQPGDTNNACIKVTANASVPGTVRGYAVNPVPSGKGLEDRVFVTVQAGTGGTFASCTGFVAEGTIIPRMTLSTLAGYDDYSDGVGGWDVVKGTQAKTYKVTWDFDATGMTQTQVDALQGAQTGIDFQWELQSHS